MIYFYVKRANGKAGSDSNAVAIWDEVSFPAERADAAQRFWVNCLMSGMLIERVGSRKAANRG